MSKLKRCSRGPEWHIQRRVVEFLTARGWMAEHTHGNLYQTGFPDLFVAHRRWGTRWIDCKQPKNYTFTKAQRLKWPVWEKMGVGIWIMTEANQTEYDKLFDRPNWRAFWKPAWSQVPDIAALLDQLQ